MYWGTPMFGSLTALEMALRSRLTPSAASRSSETAPPEGKGFLGCFYALLLGLSEQGYLAHKKTPHPLGGPEDSRHGPTVRSWCGVFLQVRYPRIIGPCGGACLVLRVTRVGPLGDNQALLS